MNIYTIKEEKIMKKTVIILILVWIMAFNMTGCSKDVKAQNLMEGITPNEITVLEDLGEYNPIVAEFALNLFKACNEKGKNTLISPVSVLSALAMTYNGADGRTYEQMEKVFGMAADDINLYFHSYMNKLPQSKNYKLSLANSIWFTDDERFTVNKDFLQTNGDYYGADIYKVPFNNKTCDEINDWIKDRTEGMIPEILDSIPSDAVMYLVNALAFEAEWAEVYYEDDVRDGVFTDEKGNKSDVEFMYGSDYVYYEDEYATGFMKYYKDCKYGFVALLPNEGVSVSEYMDTLSGENLYSMLANPVYATVHTSIPKFETDYDVEMGKTLKEMGMTDAFDYKEANFSRLGESKEGNIFIDRVLHKTYISVGEKGTKAGAATVVEMVDGSAIEDPSDIKTVNLDRPFVYMIVDCENNIPLFIGTMMNIN